MKKNRNLIVVLLLLAGATAYFILKNPRGTVRKELRDFAVKDTASITKIFLADKAGRSVTLEKKSGEWMVDGATRAKRELIVNLLEAINRVDVRTRVATAAYNTVIRTIASSGIKCEIYTTGAEPVRVYYIGGQTEDALGTFMMLENSNQPFVTHIPGFNGYLTPRYNPDPSVWQETVLFRYEIPEIKSVRIDYANSPGNSFLISNENGAYEISSPSDGRKILRPDTVAIANYLSLFRTVYYEKRDGKMNASSTDSLLSLPPAIRFAVTDTKDSSRSVDIYPMPLSGSSITRVDSLGRDLRFDLDRIYGYVRPDNQLVILQHYSFDILLRRLADFDAAAARK
jgi:hypothetical protein